jgi:hypothetical protein
MNFEVITLVRCSVLVLGANDEQEAKRRAEDELGFYEGELLEMRVSKVDDTECGSLGDARRHADLISEPE